MRFPIRRTALIAVAAASGLAMAGCSSSSTPAAAPSSAATSAASAVKLIAPGKLTVCTHLAYAPFQYPDGSGKVVGFDVDIMDLVAKKLNVTQTIVDTPFEGIKSGEVTKTGKCDISAAAMTITDERKKAILFSDGYFNATQALLLPPTSTVKSLADLKGKKLGAQSGTTGLDYANANKAATPFVDPAVASDPAVYPDAETLKRMYTPQPQTEAQEEAMTRVWTEIKTGG